MKKSKVFVVVITYKAPEKLRDCVTSIYHHWDGDTIQHIQDNSDNNILYTAGINVGIRKALAANADYIFVCCDDVKVRSGAIRALEAYLDKNEDCALAMPVQVGKDGNVNCGGCTEAFPFGKHIVEPLTHEMYKEPFESYWANGACFLLRAEAVRECGLLDENMKFICSDADYSFTLRARGWKIFVVPTALVEHEADGALHYKNAFIEKTKDEDLFYFMNKWLTGGIYQALSCEGRYLPQHELAARYDFLSRRIQGHDYEKEAQDVSEQSAQRKASGASQTGEGQPG